MEQKKVKNFKQFNESHDFEIEFGTHVDSKGYIMGDDTISEEYAKRIISNTILFQDTRNGELNITHEFLKVVKEMNQWEPDDAESHLSMIKDEVVNHLQRLLNDARQLPYEYNIGDSDEEAEDLNDNRRKPF